MNNKILLTALMVIVLPFPFLIAAEAPGATLPTSTSQASQLQRPTPPPSGTYTGEPITLDLVNVELFDFFRIVSELSGLNVIIDPDVKGTITIHVESVPWDQVFETVLKSHGLEKKIEGNVVRILTKERLRAEEELTQKLKRAAFLATDTVTVTRRLNYAKAADTARALEKQLTERGQINVDERTNTLIISDIASQIDTLSNLASLLDAPERQVEIEARVIEATTNFSRDLGVQLGLQVGNTTRDRNSGSGTVTLPATDPTSSVGIKIGKLVDTVRLDAAISAAERRGEARILSKPRVSAQNNAEARIIQGSRIPIPVTQNFTTTVRFEEAALKLTVTPQITDQNTILLKLKVENNVPDFTITVLGIPVILISESETRVLVENGGTTVLGGIFVDSNRDQKNAVPGLSSLPVVGNLFKRQLRQRDTREILFFITTRIRS
ncbi:MAG: secretin and TonB N-terminal domain-containing protein [Acidobacteria bacterium]|nr:secretin and TonB N-terminal domain-containing protein [Acidobacteriota bacterium]